MLGFAYFLGNVIFCVLEIVLGNDFLVVGHYVILIEKYIWIDISENLKNYMKYDDAPDIMIIFRWGCYIFFFIFNLFKFIICFFQLPRLFSFLISFILSFSFFFASPSLLFSSPFYSMTLRPQPLLTIIRSPFLSTLSG